MYQLEPIVTTNFIVKNFNSSGATQPSDANRALFGSEVTLDAAIGSIHATKDKPYLTMNDKVFAARFGVAAISPFDINPTAVVADVPDDSWTKDEIRTWLEDNGVEYNDGAFNHLTKDELLDAVQDVLSP